MRDHNPGAPSMNRSRIMIFTAAGFAGALAVAGIAVASPERGQLHPSGEVEHTTDVSSSDPTSPSLPDQNELEPNDGVNHEVNDGVNHEVGEDVNTTPAAGAVSDDVNDDVNDDNGVHAVDDDANDDANDVDNSGHGNANDTADQPDNSGPGNVS